MWIPIIILKLLGLGPNTVFAPAECDDKIKQLEETCLQYEVDSAVWILALFHQILAWLQAAVEKPQDWLLDDGTTRNGYRVAAEAQEEVDIKSAQAIKNVNNLNLAAALNDKAIQPVGIGNAQPVPVIEPYLKKYKSQALANFDVAKCLDACRQSLQAIPPGGAAGLHDQSLLFATTAFKAIALLWGPNLEDNLAEVNRWMGENVFDAATQQWHTADWLKGKLQVDDALANQVNKLFAAADPAKQAEVDRKKLTLSRIVTDLDTAAASFRFVYQWLTDDNNGFETTINKIKALVPQQFQAAWDQLLMATYGALAWKIYYQAKRGIWQARMTLE